METQKEEITRFIDSGRAPDIFTSAHFPYKKSGLVDSRGFFEKNPARNYLITETTAIRRALDEAGFRGEYWVTEYGISASNRNFLQDSNYRSAATVDEILPVLANADTVGMFYASDLLSAFSDTMAELSGGGGILTKNGIRKPVSGAAAPVRKSARSVSNWRLTAFKTGNASPVKGAPESARKRT